MVPQNRGDWAGSVVAYGYGRGFPASWRQDEPSQSRGPRGHRFSGPSMSGRTRKHPGFGLAALQSLFSPKANPHLSTLRLPAVPKNRC